MDLLELVPLDDTLLINAKVRPVDIAFIRPGQKAPVKVTAYDFAIYGGLDATLEQISADTIVDETGEYFFQIRVRTAKNYLGQAENPLPIMPGMIATVDISTGEKTVMDYLLKPLNAPQPQRSQSDNCLTAVKLGRPLFFEGLTPFYVIFAIKAGINQRLNSRGRLS